MGSQFAIVYDILIAVVLVFAIFSGAKRGFVSAVVGIAAVFVGFFCAMTFSAPLTELVYTSMVEKPLTEAVSQTLDDNMSSITLSGLSGMDFDSVKISGTPVSEITPDYSGTDKVVIDLSNVDLSGTGFESGRHRTGLAARACGNHAQGNHAQSNRAQGHGTQARTHYEAYTAQELYRICGWLLGKHKSERRELQSECPRAGFLHPAGTMQGNDRQYGSIHERGNKVQRMAGVGKSERAVPENRQDLPARR